MKEILNKHRSKLIYIAAFFIPAVLLTAVYAKLGFYPFGEKSILIMDMADQYVEFLASLRYAFDGDNSLLFSWARSMGGNYIGLAAYYIASPLSFITLFFSVENLPVAIMLLTILKIGLSGLTFAIYLEQGWNCECKGKFKTIVFSSCYALMSYAVIYSMSPMWLDALILLPLILLGVEKLIRGKKGFLFFISLACLFISNYYTAYMAAIFVGMYAVYRVFCSYTKDEWKAGAAILVKTAINAVFALCAAAPVILPVLKDVKLGKLATEQKLPEEVYNFDLWYLGESFFGGEYDGITNNAMPAIFCGSLVLVLAVMFFFMRKISWKEKLGAGMIAAVLVGSFWIAKLDLAWHGFVYPNWLPYRYSFLFSTLMVIVAHRAAMKLEPGLFLSKKSSKPVLLYLVTIALMFQCMELYNNTKEQLTGLGNQFGYKEMAEYQEYVDRYDDIIEGVKAKDDGFYRMEKDTEFSKNDAMLFGYNGMTHYSATYHNAINEFTEGLGMAQSHMWSSGYGSTLLTDSILNVKYRLMETSMPDSYKKSDTKNKVTVYENTMVLPIAFASGKVDTVEFKDNNNFEYQNLLFNKLAQTEDVAYYEKVNYNKYSKDLEWGYSIKAEDDSPLYMRMYGNAGTGMVYVNDSYVGKSFTSETNCILYLGQFASGDAVSVRCESEDVICSGEVLYKLNMDAFEKAYNSLEEGALEITKQKGSTIEGKIKVGKDQMIFTSIPYDEGFKVEIDGKEVDTDALKLIKDGEESEVFLTIPAEEGEHTILITYCPPGFTTGIVLAVIAWVAVLVYYKSGMLTGRKKVQK